MKKIFDLKKFLIWGLRKLSYRTPMRWEVLKAAKRVGNEYNCAMCKKYFERKQVQVDHKEPIIDPTTGFTSWDTYINNLFVSSDGLQVLCRPCHKDKTSKENSKRKKEKRCSKKKKNVR